MSRCCVISLAARSDSSDQAAATLHIQQLHGTIQLHPRTAACTVDVRIEAEAEARSSDSVQAAAGCIGRARRERQHTQEENQADQRQCDATVQGCCCDQGAGYCRPAACEQDRMAPAGPVGRPREGQRSVGGRNGPECLLR